MAQSKKRIAPHTAKLPEHCPYCGATKLVRKGVRQKKLEVVQRWQCGHCRRVFTPGAPELHGKTYPLRAVLDGLTAYCLGHPLPEAAGKIRQRHGVAVAPSTLSSWLTEYRGLTTYDRLRAEGRRRYKPSVILRSVKLYHWQVSRFTYHRAKLELLLGTDSEHGALASLGAFLERVPVACPHELFKESARASQLKGALDLTHVVVTPKENLATRIAGLVIPTVGPNRLRHDALQRFMLACDSVTVAAEVPVWLRARDLRVGSGYV